MSNPTDEGQAPKPFAAAEGSVDAESAYGRCECGMPLVPWDDILRCKSAVDADLRAAGLRPRPNNEVSDRP